jgi:hypothetical protein
VKGASRDDGANVQVWEANGSTAQRWWITKAGDAYTLINVGSRKVLDVERGSTDNGANVLIWEHYGVPNQQWRLQPTGE